jgi:acetyl-CoA carboxylase biotin carboxyl carrier protein
MSLDKLEKIIELVRRHGIHQVQLEEGGVKISVTATPPQVATQVATAPLYPAAVQHHLAPQYPAAPAQLSLAPLHPTAAPAPAEKKPAASGKVVKSPFVGTFYRSPAPGAESYCEVGKRVKKGEALCIIEAMKLMNEIEAEFDGVIKEILVDNEQPVEFDQPLFVME